ncbi:MAG TPA: TonB-dependent receptor, partial [Rhodocyclaceae bacterium]|nr:TonB-dependent receptor [Rhodocyclaceae bacterium]
EFGLGTELSSRWRIDGVLSIANHRYAQWIIDNATDYSGKTMELAPRTLGNLRLTYGNAASGLLQAEWVHAGRWWSDQANTTKYGGHNILNVRGQYPLAKDLNLFANAHNLL